MEDGPGAPIPLLMHEQAVRGIGVSRGSDDSLRMNQCGLRMNATPRARRLAAMTRTAGRETSILAALFWVPLVLAAAWIVVWPPHSVDGPAHLLGARAIADHSDAVYSTYYEIDWFPTPNLAGTRLLAVLVSLGGLRFAGTVMMLLAALGTPLALRYALRAVRPEAAWLAIAGLPLAFGYLYFYGFWNYCLAIALALVCVGLALRSAPAWAPRPTAALAALLTLTWLTHLVPFVVAVLFLAAMVVTRPRTVRSWVAPLVTVLPGALLSLAYLLHTDSGDGPTWTNPLGRALGLVSLHTTITTYSRWEDAVAVGIAAVLVALALTARQVLPASGAAAGKAAGLAAAGAAVLVLITPTNFGIEFGLIDERLAIFPVLFGLLWLAARPPEPRVAIAAATALVVATGALAVVRISDLADYDDLTEEYLSAGQYIDEGSVLVALRFANLGPDAGRNGAWDPTRHLSSELAAERHGIDVGHYEAVLDYFPARFREPNLRRAIDGSLTGLGAVPPDVYLPLRPCPPGSEFSVGPTARRLAELDYVVPSEEYIAAHPIHYVLLVGTPNDDTPARRALARVRATLRCQYDRIAATSPRGLVEVWRLR